MKTLRLHRLFAAQKLFVYLLILPFFTACSGPKKEASSGHLVRLEQQIGQMIMVGFRGTTVSPEDPIYKMIESKHIGGVVLYSRDLPSKETVARNVASPEQLQKLNRDLQNISETELLIGIDEEGGFVTRLIPENGFQFHQSHQTIGTLNEPDSTALWAKAMASELSELGINMNFGPVMDVNRNPLNPIIGARERSFSAQVENVVTNSKIFLQEHKKQAIICSPKHFPGHGSSSTDSHKGLADVTQTWSSAELTPFKSLIEEGDIQVIMTSHVYNANLDTLPSTLSPKIIDSVLRKDFGFNGVILSDDMQMRAISNFYDFETSIEKALLAGVDMLLFSNNAGPCPEESQDDCSEIPFDPYIAQKAIQHILNLVEEGKVSEERIVASYQRIQKLKTTL